MEEYIPRIVLSAILIILWPVSTFISKKLIMKYGTLLEKSELRRKQIKQIISILLNITFIFSIAVVWGVQPHNILLGLSSAFAIIGVAMFAQWSVLSNITAGILIFFSTPFKLGDRIQLLDKDMPITATIERIQTFYTHLRTDEDELIVLPNNLFLQKMVAFKKNKQD